MKDGSSLSFPESPSLALQMRVEAPRRPFTSRVWSLERAGGGGSATSSSGDPSPLEALALPIILTKRSIALLVQK